MQTNRCERKAERGREKEGKWKSLLIYELEGRALSALIMLETEGGVSRREGSVVTPMWQLRVSQTNTRTERERERGRETGAERAGERQRDD